MAGPRLTAPEPLLSAAEPPRPSWKLLPSLPHSPISSSNVAKGQARRCSRGPPLRDAGNADGNGSGAARGGGDGGCDLPFMPDHDEHD